MGAADIKTNDYMSDNTRFADVIQKYRDVFKLLAAMEDDNASYLFFLNLAREVKKRYIMNIEERINDNRRSDF